jgi:hypothetical protein
LEEEIFTLVSSSQAESSPFLCTGSCCFLWKNESAPVWNFFLQFLTQQIWFCRYNLSSWTVHNTG